MSALSQFFGCGDTSSPVPSNFKMVEFLLLGGGGGGGYDTSILDPENFRNGYGGGGGAGGMLEASNFAVKNGDTWSITIGSGGVGASYDPNRPFPTERVISSDGEPSIVNGIEIGGGGAGGNALGGDSPLTDAQFAYARSYVFGGSASSGGGSGGGGAGGKWEISTIGAGQPETFTTSSYNYSQTSSGYSLVSTVFGKTCVIKSFASPGVTFTTPDLTAPQVVTISGGGWGGGAGGNNIDLTTYRSFGRPNNITGTNVNYCRGGGGGGYDWSYATTEAVRGNRGDGGNGFAMNTSLNPQFNTAPTAVRRTCEPGGNGAFAIRWPTEYPAASSVVGNDLNLPVNQVEGFYSYRWLGDGSITF